MSEQRSGSVAFRPRARLLKLIGSELISDDVVAITELVKNAHDADASKVLISFKGVTTAEGEITISDDGYGMDLDGLLKGWMEPAGSNKRDLKMKVTPGGRRVLGEKGVGRFAADKLGRQLELVSRHGRSPDEVVALFDWDLFDSDTEMLDDVRNHWELRRPQVLTRPGTILRVSGLRSKWTERTFRRLSTRLSRLKSPFGGKNRFSITVESDEFPEYSGEVGADFLDRSPYRLDVAYDGQAISAVLNGAKHSVSEADQIGVLRCGPVRVRLHAYDLETESIAKVGPRMEARAWLREWSGISIYRDGFRLWPYGEPHDDWLRLDQRRVNNPVTCLSNNQVVGFVEIGLDANPDLRDQTNREGLIHNEALEDLRRLVLHTLHILETERQRVRHPTARHAPGQGKPHSPDALPIVARLQAAAGLATGKLAIELRGVATEIKLWVAREESERKRFVQGYSDLATIGHASIGLAQGLAPILETLREEALRISRLPSGPGTHGARKILSQLDLASSHVGMLAEIDSVGIWANRAIDVMAEIEASRELVDPLVQEREGEIVVHAPKTGSLRAEINPRRFHRVIQILTENSLEWIPRGRPPRIEILATAAGENCEILFTDNGPGIERSLGDRVFDPQFSLKEGGRGMGLTLARVLLARSGGSISVLHDGRRKGAALKITLPLKKARATRTTTGARNQVSG